MNKIAITLLCLVLTPFAVRAQKSVSELSSGQASALQAFLTKHPALKFLSETEMDKSALNDMRKNFGPSLKPYYRTGDFNYDGLQDFAMILATAGSSVEDQGPGLAKTHRYLHDLAVVVFNGQKSGQFKAAFVKNTKAPLVCFLNVKNEKRKKLYFAIYETDDYFVLVPSKGGYQVE